MKGGRSAKGTLDDVNLVVAENKHLAAQLEQNRALMSELEQEMSELKEKLEKFKPYEDILLDDGQAEAFTIQIKDPALYMRLRMRTKQAFGKETTVNLNLVTTVSLDEALNNYWVYIRKNRLPGTL